MRFVFTEFHFCQTNLLPDFLGNLRWKSVSRIEVSSAVLKFSGLNTRLLLNYLLCCFCDNFKIDCSGFIIGSVLLIYSNISIVRFVFTEVNFCQTNLLPDFLENLRRKSVSRLEV